MAKNEENTVSAAGQIVQKVFIHGETGPRILFVGNSITKHSVRPGIGWFGSWGMAASAEEKDYVHLIMRQVQQFAPEASYCIAQAADWERSFRDLDAVKERYADAIAWKPDIVVMRVVENAHLTPGDPFAEYYEKLIRLFSQGDKVILTTGFWENGYGDEQIRTVAKAHPAWRLVELGDLSKKDEMMAIDKFEHRGVSVHPGDMGMQAIADRILGELLMLL